MTETSTFTDEDLEPTQIGVSNGSAPEPVDTRSRQQKAADTRRANREANRTSVRPDDVIPPGGFQGSRQEGDGDRQQSQKEKRDEAAQRKARARRDEATKKVRYVIDANVNPVLATVARMAIGVPANMSWVEIETDESTGDLKLNQNGAPRYHYNNGAQLVILQPLEVEMICLAAPTVMEMEASERAKEVAKKIAPYAIGGGLLVLGVGYMLRLNAVRTMMADTIASMKRVDTMENEQAQAGEQGEPGATLS